MQYYKTLSSWSIHIPNLTLHGAIFQGSGNDTFSPATAMFKNISFNKDCILINTLCLLQGSTSQKLLKEFTQYSWRASRSSRPRAVHTEECGSCGWPCVVTIVCLFVCLVFNGTFSTNRLYCAIEVRSTSRMARGQYKNFMQIKQRKNTINQDNQTLFGLGFMEMIPSPRLDFLREVFLANHLASNDNLTRTTKRQNAYQLSLRF